jgi:hypothetical protein
MRVKTKIKAGKLAANHNRVGLRIALKVRSGVKSGGESLNHSRTLL